MNKTLFFTAIIVAMIAASCGNSNAKKQETVEEPVVEVVDSSNFVNLSYADAEGNNIKVIFDNNKNVAVVRYLTEEAVLPSQNAASGFWYGNGKYEVQGKGNDIVISKEGQVIYEHHDDIVTLQVKNKKGEVLDLVINNTTGEAKAYLNGGDQIDLKVKEDVADTWCSSDNYELSGSGERYQLKKDGKVVFKK